MLKNPTLHRVAAVTKKMNATKDSPNEIYKQALQQVASKYLPPFATPKIIAKAIIAYSAKFLTSNVEEAFSILNNAHFEIALVHPYHVNLCNYFCMNAMLNGDFAALQDVANRVTYEPLRIGASEMHAYFHLDLAVDYAKLIDTCQESNPDCRNSNLFLLQQVAMIIENEYYELVYESKDINLEHLMQCIEKMMLLMVDILENIPFDSLYAIFIGTIPSSYTCHTFLLRHDLFKTMLYILLANNYNCAIPRCRQWILDSIEHVCMDKSENLFKKDLVQFCNVILNDA